MNKLGDIGLHTGNFITRDVSPEIEITDMK